MNTKRSKTYLILAGALVPLLVFAQGCASGPRYGATRKSKKGCDCPVWNKVLDKDKAVWSRMEKNEPRHGHFD